MSYEPITFRNISFSYFSKDCFLDFSAQVQHGRKIGIIGPNGAGKSAL